MNENQTLNENQIASVEKNLSIFEIYEQMNIPSLGREIFFVLSQNGPLASIFVPYVENDSLRILKSTSTIGNAVPTNTEISNEAIQDLQSQFGYDSNIIIEKLLGSIASKEENLKTKEFLELYAQSEPDVTLSNSNNARILVEEISQAVNNNITSMNEGYFTTYKARVVVPMKYAMAFSVRDDDKTADISARKSYYMGKQGTAKYYVDPDATNTDTVYVVLHDELNSGGFFCDYDRTITSSIDPDTGLEKYFIFNRYAIVENPKQSKSTLITKFKLV